MLVWGAGGDAAVKEGNTLEAEGRGIRARWRCGYKPEP
jgi:hypothetical protein